MSVSDPIADMLTCIRNACQAGHRRVDVPASRLKENVVKVLEREKFVANYRRIEDSRQGVLRIYLKYEDEAGSVIRHIRRISKPGRRIYVGSDKIPIIRAGLGMAILSTPRGVLTDREAREEGVGGELLAEIW